MSVCATKFTNLSPSAINIEMMQKGRGGKRNNIYSKVDIIE